MSRAFTKEGDGDAEEELPQRPVSPLPNYVTPDGLLALTEKVKELDALRRKLPKDEDRVRDRKRKEIERDLRYYSARVESAQKVSPSDIDRSEVRIGAHVEVEDCPSTGGPPRVLRIVGEDQADGDKLISWASPLGASLLGAKKGVTVEWERDGSPLTLKVLSIRYEV